MRAAHQIVLIIYLSILFGGAFAYSANDSPECNLSAESTDQTAIANCPDRLALPADLPASSEGEAPEVLSPEARFSKEAKARIKALGYRNPKIVYWDGPVTDQKPAFEFDELTRTLHVNRDLAASMADKQDDIDHIAEIGIIQAQTEKSIQLGQKFNPGLKYSDKDTQSAIAARLTPAQVETLEKTEATAIDVNQSYARRAYETLKMLVTGEPTPTMRRFRNVLERATLTLNAGTDISHQNTWDRLPYHEGPTGGASLNARLQPGMAISALDDTWIQKALFTDVDVRASYFDGIRTGYIITAGVNTNWGEVFVRHSHLNYPNNSLALDDQVDGNSVGFKQNFIKMKDLKVWWGDEFLRTTNGGYSGNDLIAMNHADSDAPCATIFGCSKWNHRRLGNLLSFGAEIETTDLLKGGPGYALPEDFPFTEAISRATTIDRSKIFFKTEWKADDVFPNDPTAMWAFLGFKVRMYGKYWVGVVTGYGTDFPNQMAQLHQPFPHLRSNIIFLEIPYERDEAKPDLAKDAPERPNKGNKFKIEKVEAFYNQYGNKGYNAQPLFESSEKKRMDYQTGATVGARIGENTTIEVTESHAGGKDIETGEALVKKGLEGRIGYDVSKKVTLEATALREVGEEKPMQEVGVGALLRLIDKPGYEATWEFVKTLSSNVPARAREEQMPENPYRTWWDHFMGRGEIYRIGALNTALFGQLDFAMQGAGGMFLAMDNVMYQISFGAAIGPKEAPYIRVITPVFGNMYNTGYVQGFSPIAGPSRRGVAETGIFVTADVLQISKLAETYAMKWAKALAPAKAPSKQPEASLAPKSSSVPAPHSGSPEAPKSPASMMPVEASPKP